MFQIEQSVLRFAAMFKFDIFVDDYKQILKNLKRQSRKMRISSQVWIYSQWIDM